MCAVMRTQIRLKDFFSVFKNVYQHCDWRHLHIYLAEFNFRYNNRKAIEINDAQRAGNLLKNVVGKWPTYETASS